MAAPLIFGNFEIARLIKSGNCSVINLGDSIATDGTNNRVPTGVRRCWRPDRWAGAGSIANGGGPEEGLAQGYWPSSGGPAYINTSIYAPSSATDPSGTSGWSCYTASSWLGYVMAFNGGTVGADTVASTNRCNTIGFQGLVNGANGVAKKWADSGTVTYRLLTVRHPNGLASYRVRVLNNGVNIAAAELTGLSSVNATQDYVLHETTAPSADYSAVKQDVGIYPTVGTTPASTVRHLTMLGVASHGSGLRYTPLGMAGSGVVVKWSQESYISTAAMTAIVAAHRFNGCPVIVWISLGTNDTLNSKATYKSAMQTLVTKAFNAGADYVVLEGPYQASDGVATAFSDFADALYEITQANVSRILFYNRWLDLGGSVSAAQAFTALNATYLADGTHPNASGALYIPARQWAFIERCAASTQSLTSSAGVFRKPY